MADGVHAPKRRNDSIAEENEGLPLDPAIEALSAELGKALARIYFERQQAAEREASDERARA